MTIKKPSIWAEKPSIRAQKHRQVMSTQLLTNFSTKKSDKIKH